MKMTLQEYYNFPEGVVPQLKGLPHWIEDKPNFPCPADMYYAFGFSKIVELPPIDVSNVTNMANMFHYCSNLASLDVSNWDTGKVTNMNNMFYNCSALTSLDLSNLNVSKVTTMSSMFYGCEKITSLDLSNLDTSKVTDMANIVGGCKNLTSLSSLRADSLSISSYTSPLGTSKNTALVDFGGFINLKTSWNGSYCLDLMTALSHQSLINILNGLYDFTGNGVTPTSSQGKLKLGATHLATLSDDEKAIATNKGWTLS